LTPEPLLLLDRPQQGVLRLRLNRAERRNALSTPLLRLVAEALTEAEADDAVRAVVLTGGDTIFAAGADLDELAASGGDDPIDTPRFQAWAAIRAFSKPLIAAVEGWCLGAGAELMLCCDLAVAGESARLGLPETNLGIIPGAGGTATLTRLIGRARTMRMVLTGEPIEARDALACGLIAETAAAGAANARALQLAAQIAARAPLAMRAAKASIREAEALSEREHILSERRRFIALLGSADKAEGIAAFKEKRAPKWEGR
jgi:enoyl-CoA hydratase